MATKQVAAPAFPFAVSVSENTADQLPTPGALLISQTAPSAVNVNLTGVSSTSAVGTASVAGSASPALTGVSSTSAVNPPNIEIDESPALTGVAATSAVGTPTFSAGNLSIIGVVTTSAVGTPSVEGDESLTLTGVETDSAIGAPAVSAFTPANVTGVASAIGIGTPSVSVSISFTLTGVAATSGFGSVSTYSANLNGVAATVGLGAIVAQSFPILVGQAATSAAGSPSVYISTINGVQATTGIGVDIVVVTELPTLVGQQIVGLPGFLQALVSTNFTNASIAGVSLISGLGIVGTSHPGPVMAGTTASSGVGALSVTTSAIADVGMTIGQLAVEQSAGAPLVDVDLTIRWSDTEGQSWSDSVIKSLGYAGEYNTSIQVRRMGMSRHGRVYELSWSAPFPTALAGATIIFTDAGT
jgi:hypothetical protein